MPSDPPEHVEVDEKFLVEWIEFGMDAITSFLTKHAKFDAWCLEHRQEGEVDG